MSAVRALFRCSSVTHQKNTPRPDENTVRRFKFDAMYDDGVPEHERYARYTPSGELNITVDNPSVDWEVGKLYFLDFTEAEEHNERIANPRQ